MAFLKFLLRRILTIPVTLLVITAVLYGVVMFSPPDERATLYLPSRMRSDITPEQLQAMIDDIIRRQGLDQPYPVQYVRWLSGLLQGDWGWSPVFDAEVLTLLLHRTPITAELTLYSVLILVPLGLISGVWAGWRKESRSDNTFRLIAFIATSIPPFILGLVLLSVFYVGIRWFPPGRTSLYDLSLRTSTFQWYTGLLTVDALLNGRFDALIDAFRHLTLPVFTLSAAHWATLGRVTRATIIEEAGKDYILAAKARGLLPRWIVWRHAFRNALLPALTSTALSAASLVTGVFVIETIFDFHGLSELVVRGMREAPDAPLALGFAVYSVLLVIPLLLVLDILKALVDPRIWQEEE